jgi:hypothetical protein
MKRPITWLHISDLHLGQPGKDLQQQVELEFYESLRSKLSHFGAPDLILATGDLAYSGEDAEYQMFDEFMSNLRVLIARDFPGSQPLLVPVPGNHDVRRPLKSSPEYTEYAIFDDYASKTNDNEHVASISARLTQSEPIPAVERLFADYTKWLNAQLKSLDSIDHVRVHRGRLPGDLSVTLLLPNTFPLLIVGLNSAWLQYSDAHFEGKLAIPTSQFAGALPQKHNPFTVFETFRSLLLMHHPIEWQHESRKRGFLHEVVPPGRFSACLYGHMHDAQARSQSEQGGPPRSFFQAPSLFGLEKYGKKQEHRAFGYALGAIHESGEVFIWPYKRQSSGGAQRFLWDSEFGSESECPNGALINPASSRQLGHTEVPHRSTVKHTLGAVGGHNARKLVYSDSPTQGAFRLDDFANPYGDEFAGERITTAHTFLWYPTPDWLRSPAHKVVPAAVICTPNPTALAEQFVRRVGNNVKDLTNERPSRLTTSQLERYLTAMGACFESSFEVSLTLDKGLFERFEKGDTGLAYQVVLNTMLLPIAQAHARVGILTLPLYVYDDGPPSKSAVQVIKRIQRSVLGKRRQSVTTILRTRGKGANLGADSPQTVSPQQLLLSIAQLLAWAVRVYHADRDSTWIRLIEAGIKGAGPEEPAPR